MAACASVLLGIGLIAFFIYFVLYFLIVGAASDYIRYGLETFGTYMAAAMLTALIVQLFIGPLQSLGML